MGNCPLFQNLLPTIFLTWWQLPTNLFRWWQLSNARRFHYLCLCTFEDLSCTIWMRCLLTRFNHLIISNDSETTIHYLFHWANGLNDDDSTVFFRQDTRYYSLMKNLDEHLTIFLREHPWDHQKFEALDKFLFSDFLFSFSSASSETYKSKISALLDVF